MKKIAFDPYAFSLVHSPVGVPVYFKKIPWVKNWIEIRIILAIGAKNDPQGKEGLSHFLEHLSFAGAIGFSRKDIDTFYDAFIIGRKNAATSFDGIVFEIKIFKENILRVADFFKHLLFGPNLNEIDIVGERGIIIQEIKEHFKNEHHFSLAKKFRELAYGANHPFGRMISIAGCETTVNVISQEDLLTHHQTHCHLGNLAVILAGDINEEESLSFVEKLSQGINTNRPTNEKEKKIRQAFPLPQELRIEKKWKQLGEQSKTGCFEVLRLTSQRFSREIKTLSAEIIRQAFEDLIRGEYSSTYHVGNSSCDYFSHGLFSLYMNCDPRILSLAEKKLNLILKNIRESNQEEKRFQNILSHRIQQRISIDNPVHAICENAVTDVLSEKKIVPLQEEIKQMQRISYANIQQFIREELPEKSLIILTIRP